MLQFNKKTNEYEFTCNRCTYQAPNLREYILHKKNLHHVRVKDTIESMRTLGFDEPELYDSLLAEYANEKVHPEYRQWAKGEFKRIMADAKKY